MSEFDVHASADEKRDGLVRRAALVGRRGPDDVLHADRKFHDLFGERIEEDPARDDRMSCTPRALRRASRGCRRGPRRYA